MTRRLAETCARCAALAAVCLVVAHAGCTSTTFLRPASRSAANSGQPSDRQTGGAPVTREERKAAVIESAERRREKMQYQAAVSRWNEGEAAGCQRLLMALLGRRADFRDARRLLADVCLARHDLPEAELHLRILLEQDPNDAQTHHSLGLLLEESGRRDEALFHLDRAAGLEPANELYALSRDAAQHTWH